jgi:hypothetical protein
MIDVLHSLAVHALKLDARCSIAVHEVWRSDNTSDESVCKFPYRYFVLLVFYFLSAEQRPAYECSSSSAGCDAEAWAFRCAVQRQIMVSRGREQRLQSCSSQPPRVAYFPSLPHAAHSVEARFLLNASSTVMAAWGPYRLIMMVLDPKTVSYPSFYRHVAHGRSTVGSII